MAITITDKQRDLIETLSRKAGFRNPQAACTAANMPSRNWRYDLTSSDASDLIQQLKDGLAPEPEPEPIPVTMPEGGPSAEQLIAMLGRTLRIATPKNPAGWRVEVRSIALRDGALVIEVDAPGAKFTAIPIANITGWSE